MKLFRNTDRVDLALPSPALQKSIQHFILIQRDILTACAPCIVRTRLIPFHTYISPFSAPEYVTSSLAQARHNIVWRSPVLPKTPRFGVNELPHKLQNCKINGFRKNYISLISYDLICTSEREIPYIQKTASFIFFF